MAGSHAVLPDEIDVPHAVVRVVEETGIQFVFGMPGGDTGAHLRHAPRLDRGPDDPRAARAGRLDHGGDVTVVLNNGVLGWVKEGPGGE